MQVNRALGKAAAATANIGALYVSDEEDEDDDVNLNEDLGKAQKANLGDIKNSNQPEGLGEDEESKQINLSEHLMED
jgi:hypothetical protein